MATKNKNDVFVKKLEKLEQEYQIILAHIDMLQEQRIKKEAEIQAFLDKSAGLT